MCFLNKKERTSLLVAFFLLSAIFLQFGCDNNKKEIEAEHTKLALAKQKNDLDSMFLSLSQLKSLGDTSQETAQELKNVSTAIGLLEDIKVNQGDHNHENVVKNSHDLLQLFPNHPYARKSLKESGLIFSHLQVSLEIVNDLFEKEPISLVKNEMGEIDFENIFFKIGEAKKHLAEAKKIDVFFTQTTLVQDSLIGLENTLAHQLIGKIVLGALDGASGCEYFFNYVYPKMRDSITDNYEFTTPSYEWKSASSVRKVLETGYQKQMDKLSKLVEVLQFLKTSEKADEIGMTQRMFLLVKSYYSAVTNPKGNIRDYREGVNDKIDQLTQQANQLHQFLPTKSQLKKDTLNALTIFIGFNLFKTPDETRPILEKHDELLSNNII